MSSENTTLADGLNSNGLESWVIGVIAGGAVLLILAIIFIIYCVKKVQRKRAFEGKYSPTRNEEKGGVGMNDMINVIQVPKPERLI